MNTNDERGGWTSASSAEADALCPGRHIAQSGIPEGEQSDDAAAGTRIHEWLAAHLNGSDLHALSEQEKELAVRCWEQAQECVKAWAGDCPVNMTAENRRWISFGSVMHSGKADLVVRTSSDVGLNYLVIDYKTGRGAVEDPSKNMQLRDLACLMEGDPLSVTVQIIQPLAGRSTPCEYDFGDLKQARSEMRARVLASNDPQAKRLPGSVQCQYCRAKRTCPEYAGQLAVVPAHSLAAMKPERLGEVLTICRQIGEEAEKEVRRLLDMGIEVPGWKLEPGHNRTEITNPQGVWARCYGMGVSASAFMEAVKLTKNGLEKVLRSATGAKGKELAAKLDAVLDGNTETKPGSARLVST